MAYGVPVVATGWSGNLEFMEASDSCLVPYRLVQVSDRSAIYRNSTWAEPDLDVAAQALRRLADDPAHCVSVAAAAYRRASASSPRFPFPAPRGTPSAGALPDPTSTSCQADWQRSGIDKRHASKAPG
jgi:hypothetical protein